MLVCFDGMVSVRSADGVGGGKGEWVTVYLRREGLVGYTLLQSLGENLVPYRARDGVS